MDRPPESMKSFANHVARAVYSEETAEALRLLRLSGLFGQPVNANGNHAESSTAATRAPQLIGIWEPKFENGKTCFVRRIDLMAEWPLWANIGRIEPKGPRRRVVLIGESVARGYLYDPEFTPAMALEMILEPQFGKGEIEVIDLARTNLGFEVRELAVAALQLEPDIVIIFGGNNWNIAFPTAAEIAEVDGALMTDGLAGAKRMSEVHIRNKAIQTVNDTALAYQNAGVPLVWIIPEFNLGDWRDAATNAPYLPHGHNREWLILLDEARRALSKSDYERARESATRLLEIDRGVCVASLYILAECSRHAGDLETERRYLEQARDAIWWDPSRVVMPRCISVSQQTIREEPLKYNNYVIDLPALFKEYLNGGIPGRQIFLDYCHMTSEGIRVAMGAAAACVLRALKKVEVPWYALINDSIGPPVETEAEASFLAAIHNGHSIQPYDLVRHYCRRALNQSPHVAELMLNYLESQTCTFMTIVGDTVEEISKMGSPLMRHYLLRLNERRLDKMLLDAIVEALAEVGIDAQPRLDELRKQEHSVTRSETDLLDYYYCSAAEQPQELAWVTPRAKKDFTAFEVRYYRAFWLESKFVFVGEAGCAVRLSLTCRLPRGTGDANVGIDLNRRKQVEFTIGDRWSTWDIDLPGAVIRDGLNEITIHWPIPEFAGIEELKQAVLKLSDRKVPSFYQIFGEIHSFTAADGRSQPALEPLVQQELAVAQTSL